MKNYDTGDQRSICTLDRREIETGGSDELRRSNEFYTKIRINLEVILGLDNIKGIIRKTWKSTGSA